ncbi:PREDICTED: metabotropic glutamate receptor 8-like [Wasmannia auropunctata]|uniref:metabotropic glutamate receptor 8-like n=1 Tax=Wasmannia auropunctata TaxID=64793 RepID=UPI0005F082C9|nr:PREDICTED: metabotropic glutamate receptor 8-like [Wasmannia auropunctata]
MKTFGVLPCPDEAESGTNRLECIEGLHARVDISILFLITRTSPKLKAQFSFVTSVSCASGVNQSKNSEISIASHSDSSASVTKMNLHKILPWIWCFLITSECYNAKNKGEDGSKLIRIDGDIILGGIFPMHEQVAGSIGQSPCGAVKEEKGIQRLEAMLYVLDQINNDTDLLPNTTLGALILDSCSSDTYALDQSMEFVRSYMNQDISEYKCENGKTPTYVPHKPVTGVIGAAFSVVSIMVANILRLFKIPQISYASTSTELSDKSRFEYFSRVVPPDNFQAQAIVEVIHLLGWKYVSTVAVEGEYGEKGIASFIALSLEYNICVAVSEKILRNSKTEDFDRIIERLSSKHNARGVIIFVDEDNIRKLLQATIRANRTGHFMWVGSDSWGAKVYPVRDQEFAAEGAITILPYRNVLKDFDSYYLKLRPRMGDECGGQTESNVPHKSLTDVIVNCRNIWFREFWSQHHKCTFSVNASSDMTRCTGEENLFDYEQEGLVPFVVDAVYAMAHGVHNVIEEECVNNLGTSHYLCESLVPAPDGPRLLQHIRNVSFTGRQNTEIKFNSDGDAYGFYNIYQYQRKDEGRFDYTLIGTWKEELSLDINMTRWATGVGELHIPRSMCSDNCPMGHVRNFVEPCCWSCVACREDAYVYNDTCKKCNPGYAPNSTMTGCIKLTAEVIPWTSPWALVPLIFASIGILSTLFTTVVFIRFNRTPVIMASGRELCYVLLVGILSCYGMSFVILSKPTTWNCTYLRIGLGLCLSICYSAILTKTNRISRIFNQGTKKIKRLSYTSPKSQVVIAIGITAVQLIGTIVWLMIEPPDTTEIHPYPLSAVLTCRVSTFSLMMSLVYNMFLILMCTLYAFKTRKIPEDFNEAKYIGFTMYSTCIVWLAFVPIYFGTNNDYKVCATDQLIANIIPNWRLDAPVRTKAHKGRIEIDVKAYANTNTNANDSINLMFSTGGLQSGNRAAYSMRFAGGRSQTMQSVTSGSRSSPPMSRGGAGAGAGAGTGRADERKHANGGGCSCGGGGGNDNGDGDDDDEDERKLSTVQELPELTASPPMSLVTRQARERSQDKLRHDSDQPSYRNEAAISSISEKVEARARKERSCSNEEQILSYSDSPTFSEFSS